jgi:excisionase family DNA binding protein
MVASDILYVDEVSSKFKVPRRTVRDWASKGVIPAFSVGKKKKWVFRAADVEQSERRLSRAGQEVMA